MAPHPSQIEPLQRMTKIVNNFLQRPDIGPFREPVDWRGLELHDYPKVIKKMMDLGTVKRKLDRKQYYTAAECADDIRLIWSNCMTYNADGSDFWLLAKSFARRFEDRYRKIRQEFDVGANLTPDGVAPADNAASSKSSGGGTKSPKDADSPSRSSAPALDVRAKFGANLFLLSGIELAHVIMTLEQECPQALEHVKEEVEVEDEYDPRETTNSTPKLEINVDEIPQQVFVELSAYVMDKVGSKGHSDVKVDDITASRPKKKQRK